VKNEKEKTILKTNRKQLIVSLQTIQINLNQSVNNVNNSTEAREGR
jgi:hypothetical protein